MIIIENNKVAAEKLINKSTKLKDLEKTEYFQKFYELDPTSKRYPDNPKFLITLIKWFLDDPIERQYNLIKLEFETYLEQVRLNHWKAADVVIKDISKFPKFQDFATEVHRITAKYRKSDSKEQSDEVKDLGSKIEVLGKKIDKKDVTLQKDDVVVVRADTMQKSIQYGSGFSDWCTARTSGNYFYEYRFGNYGDVGESTIYYVYFPKRYSEDPNDSLSVLHFGANEDGKISYTDRTNTESVESLSWLKNQFDEFEGVNMEEVFPHKPITPSERKVRDLPDEMTDDDFYKLSNEDKLMYLQSSDRYINLNKFKSMSDDLKSSYLGVAENSQLLLTPSVLNLIKNTSYGRRYIKGMSERNLEMICSNLIRADDAIFSNRQTSVELINSIVENKKDNITPIGLYHLLHASFQHKSSFDKNTFLSTVNTFGKSKLNILLVDHIYHLITDFTFFDELPLIEEVLGKENISRLNVGKIALLLNRAELVEVKNPSFCVDIINFVIKYFGERDNIASTLIRTISELSQRSVPIVNKQTLLFKLIDLRPSLSSSFVTTVLTHSIGTKLEVLNYIGNRFDINRLNDEEINKIFTSTYVKPENLIDFEKSLGRLLSKLSLKNIAQNMLYLPPDNTNEIVDLLIKYTINNWNSEIFQILLTVISPTDEKKIKYINSVGIDRLHNKLTGKSLYAILESSTDPVSIIDVFGVNYVRSSLVKEDFKRLVVRQKFSNDVNDKLINFLVKYFDLSSEDIAVLFQTSKNPSRIKDLIGTINFEKVDQKDILSIFTNKYIDSVVYEKLLQLFGDKVLQLNPEQINNLLERSKYTLFQTVDFLLENNYNFTNDQIVTILIEAIILAYMSSVSADEVLKKYFDKIGVDKIKNLDNKSIVKLLKSGFDKIEFLFSYVPINSLDAPTIVEILKFANSLSYGNNADPKTFERVFTMLESVLNKLNQLNSNDIMSLMRTGHQPSKKLFDYIIKKNPSMLTPSLILSLLRGLIDTGVFKYERSSIIIEQIGAEKINKALDEFPKYGGSVSSLLDKDNFYEFKMEAAYALISIMSPANLDKISDNVFSQLVRSFGFTSGRVDDFSVFLKKPNLTSSNIVQLIQYVPDKFYKNNLLESLKPQLNKLTPEEILIPLIPTHYYSIALSRLTRIVNFLGKTTIDRLSGDDIFSILNQTRYDAIDDAVFKLLLAFGENLYKLSQKQIDDLHSGSKFFKKYNIEMASFCKTKQISEWFMNQIRESNHEFLLDFGMLYFDNFTDVTDYLRVISQYIQTHNNTLTFREFSAIVETIDDVPVLSIRNAILTFLSKVLKGTFKTYWKQYKYPLKHNDKPITEYKRFYSDLLLENSPFSQENLEKALDIERKAYPPHMQLINSYVEDGGTLDIYDIADYLECGLDDIIFHMGSNWFIIGCVDGNELEIADWASDGGMSPNAIKAFFGVLRQYKDKTISCSARETTSYSLIKQAERVGYVTVLEEEAWNWGGVKMVDMKFKFNDDFMNRIGKK